MKKSIIILVVLASLTFFSKVEASETKYITITNDTKAYHNVAGDEVVMAILLKGQTYQLLAEDQNFFYLSFGNDRIYIDKTNVTLSNQANYETKSSKYTTNETVITTSKVAVYPQPSTKEKGFAYINTNIRYPIVGKTEDYYQINFGGRNGYIHKNEVEMDRGIPVLMYHHIVEDSDKILYPNNSMVITVSSFKEQMDYLKKNGWRTINIRELDNYLHKRKNLTGKVVLVTFDDGNLSTKRYAYPILEENRQHAVSFLIGDRIREKALPWDVSTFQYVGLQEMVETKDVFDFQHHTYSMHVMDKSVYKAKLLTSTYEEIVEDLQKGKEKIGQINHPNEVKYIAYPWGKHDEKTLQALKDLGFRMAFTTETGNVMLGDHLFKLKRQGISPEHTLDDFISKLDGTYVEK